MTDQPFQAQGIVGDCNIEVLLRLQGGGRDGRGKRGGGGTAGEGRGEEGGTESQEASKTNEEELKGTSFAFSCRRPDTPQTRSLVTHFINNLVYLYPVGEVQPNLSLIR